MPINNSIIWRRIATRLMSRKSNALVVIKKYSIPLLHFQHRISRRHKLSAEFFEIYTRISWRNMREKLRTNYEEWFHRRFSESLGDKYVCSEVSRSMFFSLFSHLIDLFSPEFFKECGSISRQEIQKIFSKRN